MPKNKIKVKINGDLIIVDCTINNDIIEYNEKDGTKVTYDLIRNILMRDNDELNMIYDFDNKKGNILIKELGTELEISINNIKIDKKDNNIKINYSIEDENYVYELEVI